MQKKVTFSALFAELFPNFHLFVSHITKILVYFSSVSYCFLLKSIPFFWALAGAGSASVGLRGASAGTGGLPLVSDTFGLWARC